VRLVESPRYISAQYPLYICPQYLFLVLRQDVKLLYSIDRG